jgi:hypothetical protein
VPSSIDKQDASNAHAVPYAGIPACAEGETMLVFCCTLLHNAANEQKPFPPYPRWHLPAPLRCLGCSFPLSLWCRLVSAASSSHAALYGPRPKGQAMSEPKKPKPSRVSVPLSGEALHAFQILAKAQNVSTGKAIAEWLEETIDAVLYLSKILEEARSAPKLVAQKMHAFALGLADESGALLEQIKTESKQRAQDAQRPTRDGGFPVPPPCNTGGKVPKKTTNKHVGRS